ncbi:peptidoglycan-binding domain-containing protein [Streptomyces olivaceus]
MNRNRFKVGAISAVIGVISTLLVGLTASPASAATPECNSATITTAVPNTPSGRYLYLPRYYNGGGSNYYCWMAYGTTGEGVTALQQAINLCYNNIPNLEVDWIYGSATRAAVRAVQAEHRIKVDGEYGPDTYSAMRLPLYRTVDNGFSGACM